MLPYLTAYSPPFFQAPARNYNSNRISYISSVAPAISTASAATTSAVAPSSFPTSRTSDRYPLVLSPNRDPTFAQRNANYSKAFKVMASAATNGHNNEEETNSEDSNGTSRTPNRIQELLRDPPEEAELTSTNKTESDSLEKEPNQVIPPGICVECEHRASTCFCAQCEDEYCDACFLALHRKGSRTQHEKLPPPERPVHDADSVSYSTFCKVEGGSLLYANVRISPFRTQYKEDKEMDSIELLKLQRDSPEVCIGFDVDGMSK